MGRNTRNFIQYFLTLVLFTFYTYCILRCIVCVVVSCLVCIVVVVLCVLLFVLCLLLCMYCSVYSVSLCCSVYCLCVNVYLKLPPSVNPTAVSKIYQHQKPAHSTRVDERPILYVYPTGVLGYSQPCSVDKSRNSSVTHTT